MPSDAAFPRTPSYEERLERAVSLQQALSHLETDGDASAQETAERWLAARDPQSHVGSLHHTVPRFLLDRWAQAGKVRVYSRINNKYSLSNVKDLAVRDFYTFIDQAGKLDSTFEALLGVVESPVADIIHRLLSPFFETVALSAEEKYALAQFAAFQAVRTTRRRRELELYAEYYAKTLASEDLADEDLRLLSIVPHQNTLLGVSMQHAQHLVPLFAFRPLEVVFLQGTRLYVGDEPLVINGALDERHTADCFMTESEFEHKLARESRKKLKRRKPVSRIVHFRPTQGQGIGVALELLLPISPRAVLWWGPLQQQPFQGRIQAHRLSPEESAELAETVNAHTMSQALDWIVSEVGDDNFLSVDKPPLEPLMSVCDGDNAASAAVNTIPTDFRPHRLVRSK